MEIKPLKLLGTYEINCTPRHDDRGYFMRSYDETLFRQYGLTTSWLQENQSLSTRKGVIRGFHFQKPPYAETKLRRAVLGAVLEVFVDLRLSSKTYGHWDAIELSDENKKLVYIPKGFATAICTLTEQALVVYKVDTPYNAESEGGLRWNDEFLGIKWPIDKPYLSTKDASWEDMINFNSPFA